MNEEFKILENLKKQSKKNEGFSVPDDYFESFEDKVMDRIHAEEQPLGKKIMLVLKPWLSLAAIFTVIALVYYNTPYIKTSNTLVDASISNDYSIDLISADFDELELFDIISEENNNAIFETINTDPELLDGITYEDIEDLVIF